MKEVVVNYLVKNTRYLPAIFPFITVVSKITLGENKILEEEQNGFSVVYVQFYETERPWV